MRYGYTESSRFYSFSIAEPKGDYKKSVANEQSVNSSNDTGAQRTDSDGAWKYALEVMLFEFLQLFMPKMYELIDTSVKPESKETELKGLLPDSKPKQRIVDKLVKVKYKNGKSAFLLIHIEIESKANTYSQQNNFAARMYEYYTMLSSKFINQEIVNIGVLINSQGPAFNKSGLLNNKTLDPNASKTYFPAFERKNENNKKFGSSVLKAELSVQHQSFLVHEQSHPSGQMLAFKFPVIHLAKWAEREDELKVLAYKNPFAIMVLYQLIALKYKNKNKRLNAKVQIMRLGNQYGYSREMMGILLYLIDWVITLPEDLQDEYYEEVKKMETEAKERFVSIYEIMGKKEGLAEGQVNILLKQMSHKFNNIPDAIVDRVKSASLDQIEAWSINFINAQTIDEVFGD